MDLVTSGHCLRSGSVKLLQRTTLAESVFRLLVDGARAVGEVLTRSAGQGLRVGGARPRLDLDRLGHLVGDDTGCVSQVEGHAGRGRYGLTGARGVS